MNHMTDCDINNNLNTFAPGSPNYIPGSTGMCFKCERDFHVSELVYLEKAEGMLMPNEEYCEGCLSDNDFYKVSPMYSFLEICRNLKRQNMFDYRMVNLCLKLKQIHK